jgi:DNA (cytosine-5)-methyltransferase 1
MTYGSLFSGIGGMDLGFDRAGLQCVWQCEIAPYCRKVLAKHWPDVPKHDDVTTFNPEQYGTPDIIAGGFPCQDISVAGKRAGIERGERSGLWREFARIIRVARPRYVVVENVPGLLVSRDGEPAAIGRVLGDLAACGFDAEWTSIPAWAFGSTQTRWRVFIVAYPVSLRPSPIRVFGRLSKEITADFGGDCDARTNAHFASHRDGSGRLPVFTRESLQEDTYAQGCLESDDSHADGITIRKGAKKESNQGRERRSSGESHRCDSPFVGRGWWGVEPNVVRMVYGVPRRLVRDRIRALGNCVIPQVAEWIARQVIKHAEATQ